MKLALRHVARLLRFVLPHWRGVLLTVGFSIVAAIGQASRPFLIIPVFKYVFPDVGASGAGKLAEGLPFQDRIEALFAPGALFGDLSRAGILWVIAGVGLLLAILSAVGSFGQEYFGKWVRSRAEIDAQNRVFQHISTLSLRFFHRTRSGELISKLTNDLALLRKAVEFLCGDVIEQPIKIAVCAMAAFVLSWKLSLIGFVAFPLLVIPMIRFGKKIRRSARKRQSQQADVTDSMSQAFSGIRVVKAFHREEEICNRFREQTEEYFRGSMRVVRRKALARSLTEAIYSLGFVLFFLIGGFLALRGGAEIDPGLFAAFILSLVQIYPPIKALSNAVAEVQESLAGADRLFNLFDEKPLVVDRSDARPLSGVREGVSLRKVSFAYDGDPVLVDVDLSARRGEMIALVGPSGAGKSTLCDLIARFYDPRSGSITIDGVDIREFTVRSLLDHISIVTQEPFLFNTTIEENIRYGRLDATRAEVESAAKAAHIHDFVATLPDGYSTIVGERGANLSGGQKQRITIARAILKDSPVLILDEATSSLDSESEAAIQGALANLVKGRTTFVIAHRLSTIQHADQIVVLDQGRIVDRGRHEELLSRDGIYRRLYQLQFRDAPLSPASGAAVG